MDSKRRYILDKTVKGINQKYGELVALRVEGGGNRAYFCLGPFYKFQNYERLPG